MISSSLPNRSASRRISIGLVGASGFGRVHLQALRELQEEGAVRLAAVADPFVEECRPELQHALRNGARFYRTHREMLDREKLDAIAIAAPIPVHHEIARDCLERDVYIYLEKPAVPDFGQFQDLMRRDFEQRIAVAFQLIESDWSRAMKEWIVSGRLGVLHDIRAGACWPRATDYYDRAVWAGRMSLGGKPIFDGPATNALSHLLHGIMYLASPEAATFAVPEEVQGELYRARPIESYDTVCLRGVFSSGTRFHAAFTHAVVEEFPYQIEVRGSEGWARLSANGSLLESSLLPKPLRTDSNVAFSQAYCSFLEFVRGDRPHPGTLLRDTLGYAVTTNALPWSSGGIHSIDSGHVRVCRGGEGEFFDVRGLGEAVQAGLGDGKLFSEREVPWSVPSAVIAISDDIGLAPVPERLA